MFCVQPTIEVCEDQIVTVNGQL